MSKKWKIILGGLLALLAIAGFIGYKILFPTGPITDSIPNPISDKATLSKDKDESNVTTNPLKNAYFGDLHVHTCFSFDAYIGGTTATPSDAYRFAKGETVSVLGENVKIQRPLDFAAVTDHAEFIGELYSIQTPGAPAYQSAMARYFRSLGWDTVKQRELFLRIGKRANPEERNHFPIFQGFETTKSAWNINLEAAEKHYDPGKFTTFAAYEWTLGVLGRHLHRNVFFRDMKVPDYPISALEADTPEKLWAYLKDITNEGATVMAVPHNSNIGGGGVFPDAYEDGREMDKAYAQTRQNLEPLIEVHQAKGNSEVHAAFWQNDEFADFENYTNGEPIESNYVRYALKKGLEHEEKIGVNPFKFGIIGSTDTHNATAGNTEENDDFIGNHAFLDLEAKRRRGSDWILDRSQKTYRAVNPGGLVAIWAEANTRGHLYDAMKQKETYATSGGRIQVRFFGGYDFEDAYEEYETMVKDGYEKGVPMGGDLPKPPSANASPSFLIWAGKDAESANLDRIQVVKGWYKEGKLQEKIFNVALSDSRTLSEDGSVPDNGATVNMETGEWSKDKGDSELKTIWTDPEFDASVRAFYYLRVLELPTARWTLWDKIRYGSEFPEGTELTVRERAWSSPIWYSPPE